MNNTFLSDLCAHCTEDIPPLQDKALHEHFLKLEQEFISRMGYDFVMQYQQAAGRLYAHEFDAAFLRGLQFSAHFLLTVLPLSSPPPPPPSGAAPR